MTPWYSVAAPIRTTRAAVLRATERRHRPPHQDRRKGSATTNKFFVNAIRIENRAIEMRAKKIAARRELESGGFDDIPANASASVCATSTTSNSWLPEGGA